MPAPPGPVKPALEPVLKTDPMIPAAAAKKATPRTAAAAPKPVKKPAARLSAKPVAKTVKKAAPAKKAVKKK